MNYSVFHKINCRFLLLRKFIKKTIKRDTTICYIGSYFFKNNDVLLSYFFTVFSIFKVIVFQKSTEFEFEFSLRIPVVNS